MTADRPAVFFDLVLKKATRGIYFEDADKR